MTSSPPAGPADTPNAAAAPAPTASPADLASRLPRPPAPGPAPTGDGPTGDRPTDAPASSSPEGASPEGVSPEGVSPEGAPLIESVRRRLAALDGRPLAEQPESLERVYADLQAALAQIDT